MVVSEIMTPAPYVIEATQSVREAMRQLALAEIRHLPVLDEGQLVGMISDRDIRGVATVLLSDSGPGEQLDIQVSSIMSSDVLTVDPETDVADAISLMLEHKVGALPVIGDAGLLGVVSYVDVLREAQATLSD